MSDTSSDDDLAYHIAFSDSDDDDDNQLLSDDVLKTGYRGTNTFPVS
jgi:hypothetical protein